MAAFNKIIHERARLLIMTYLASHEKESVSFTELQEQFDFTSGNLSVQLKKLEVAGYVAISKTFKDNKPFTTVSVTSDGSRALNDYLEEMENIISALKKE